MGAKYSEELMLTIVAMHGGKVWATPKWPVFIFDPGWDEHTHLNGKKESVMGSNLREAFRKYIRRHNIKV